MIQITGPVVDIEFPAGPAAGDLQRRRDRAARAQEPLVCEVQQHLGNNWVRSVAMTTTDGLARGVDVRDTGAADHRPGRRCDARARLRRARPPDRQQGPRERRAPAADPSRAAGLRRPDHRGRGLRDRPQGHRPHLPVQEGRQDRHLRRRRRRQDGHHPGADPQRRPGARGRVRVRGRRRAQPRGQRPHRTR